MNHRSRRWRKRLLGALVGLSLGWLAAGYAPTFSSVSPPAAAPSAEGEQPNEDEAGEGDE